MKIMLLCIVMVSMLAGCYDAYAVPTMPAIEYCSQTYGCQEHYSTSYVGNDVFYYYPTYGAWIGAGGYWSGGHYYRGTYRGGYYNGLRGYRNGSSHGSFVHHQGHGSYGGHTFHSGGHRR